MPTKNNPLSDAITGATPKSNFDIKLTPTAKLKQFIIKAEFNHSTDFNDFFPKSAKESDENYSGGKNGSGQPAIIYKIKVDLSSDKKIFNAALLGHSSVNGNDGDLYTDVSKLTTALNIVKDIVVTIQ